MYGIVVKNGIRESKTNGTLSSTVLFLIFEVM